MARTKQSIVVATIAKVSAPGENGCRVLKKAFFELLEGKGQYKTYPQILFVGYGNLRLFYCFPVASNTLGREELSKRYLSNVKYRRPEEGDKNIQGFDNQHDVYLTTQLGEGNLKAFVALVNKYQEKTGETILTQKDAAFLCAPKNARKKQDLNCEDFPLNRIVFGAPGTGKSRLLEVDRQKTVENEKGEDKKRFFEDSCYERVTFYPTYSYAQFVGSYKPVMKDVNEKGFKPKEGEPTRKAIAYEFVPGPFLRILKDALRNKDKNYLLIIEEINRANAAAVFGDVFQLLDRKNDDDADAPAGWSDYNITPSREMIDYLTGYGDVDEGISEEMATKLRIPSNLYIWATMNSADQGVFPLDTAFKRRWDFEYMSLDDNESNDECSVDVGKDCSCEWGDLRKAINSLLKRNQVNEDKLLSSSFVHPDGDEVISSGRFKMKVLMYLWEDAARMCRRTVFKEGLGAFSDLIEEWDSVKYSEGDEDILKKVFQFDDSKTERLKFSQREDVSDSGSTEGTEGVGEEGIKQETSTTEASAKDLGAENGTDVKVSAKGVGADAEKKKDEETPKPQDETKGDEGPATINVDPKEKTQEDETAKPEDAKGEEDVGNAHKNDE